jgi:hypothetical protein
MPRVTARPRQLPETEFQAQVCELAEIYGWSWLHIRALRTKYGWRVPTSGPLAKGWPDLILVKPGVTAAVELKRDGEHPTPEQVQVLALLSAAGFETRVWWPKDWDVIQAFLSGRSEQL